MDISYKKGFTLMEILVVLAIIVFVVAVILPRFGAMRERQVFKSTVENILSTLDKAHSQSLASIDSSSYGVHFESDEVVLFKGTTYSALDSSNEITSIPTPASISDISLTGEAVDVYFDRLTGAANVGGTVTVSTDSFSAIITISETGTFSTDN